MQHLSPIVTLGFYSDASHSRESQNKAFQLVTANQQHQESKRLECAFQYAANSQNHPKMWIYL